MEVLASLVLLRSKLRGIEPLCSDFDSDVVPASQSHVLARQNKTELETKKRQIADLQKQIKDLETNTHGIENHLRTLKAQMAQHDQAMRMAQQEFAKLNSTKK